jgi:hypothetical protein
MDNLTDKIVEALGLMDTLDDDQWTADGAPKVDAVSVLSGLENLKRADIINVAPKFSRENPDVSAKEEEETVIEETPSAANSLGWKHPEILEAQADFDEIVKAEAQMKAEKTRRGEVLTEVTNRLMLQKNDKRANQIEIMRTIKASNDARAGRVSQFQKNRALLTNEPPSSPLDQAQKSTKKTRPLM